MQFTEDKLADDFGMLDCIPKLITEEKNESITRLLSGEEIKRVVFELNGGNAAGLDGFTRTFYK